MAGGATPPSSWRVEVGPFGAAAGVEIGFGALRPANAGRLPLQYAWPLAPQA